MHVPIKIAHLKKPGKGVLPTCRPDTIDYKNNKLLVIWDIAYFFRNSKDSDKIREGERE
jgi:hypothetical protein